MFGNRGFCDCEGCVLWSWHAVRKVEKFMVFEISNNNNIRRKKYHNRHLNAEKTKDIQCKRIT